MQNIGEIAGALVTLITALGGALTYVWRAFKAFKKEVRADLDDARADLDACRAREVRDQERRTIEQERRGLHRVVIELFWQEIRRVAPDSPVLARAEKVMNELDEKDNAIAAKDRELMN